MPDHTEIYSQQAKQYDLLISRQTNVDEVLKIIQSPQGLDIIDMGAGTGRFTCKLAPEAKSIRALDVSSAMLEVIESKMKRAGLTNYRTQTADHRQLPVEDHSADLVVSGWSICYLGSSNLPNWEENINQVMTEIKRVLRPNGTAIILETMGTGTEKPNPPAFLKDYYGLLESKYGFSHTVIRTDYQFFSSNEAEELTRFFFGDSLANRVAEQGLVHLPECAGVWWRKF